MNHGACGHSCRPALCEPKENDPRVTRGWALIREDRDGTRGKDLPQEGETCALRPAFGPGHQPCARPKLCGGGGRPGMRRAVRRGLGTVPGGGRLGSTMKDEFTRRRGKTGALPRAASPLQLLPYCSCFTGSTLSRHADHLPAALAPLPPPGRQVGLQQLATAAETFNRQLRPDTGHTEPLVSFLPNMPQPWSPKSQ